MKYYSGVGSRETSTEILKLMQQIALDLSAANYVLRSGGADGADLAFESGASQKEIFLPWKGFNNNSSPLFYIPDKAFEISALHHPRWKQLREPVKKLMARNAQQVLGKNLDSPVEFIILWTPDGCIKGEDRTQATGGTGQAISIASSLNIPVYNLQREMDRQLVEELIEQLN